MYNLNFIKKLFWLFLFIVVIFSAFGFAKDDCEDVFATASWWLFNDFMTTRDLEIARDHLRSYCCIEKPALSALIWKCDNLVMWPESPYWYDHLIDVGLRRLDAESLYPGMSVDTQWSGWRTFLKDTENMKNPEAFLNAYTWYWIQSWTYLFAYYTWSDYWKGLGNILKNSKWFNLHDKYLNYCFISMMMYYQWLWLHNIDIVTDWYYGTCLSMVKARIRQETSLAVMVSQYNAATLLTNAVSAYTKNFVQNRLMKLFDKLVAISSLFNTLAKQAPLSDTCTK